MNGIPIWTRAKRRWPRALTLAVVSPLLAYGSSALAEDPVNTGYFGDVAIKGYDPVAYFTMDDAVRGSEEFAHKWLGATWLFANAEHRQMFAQSPVKYAPEYGGFCAIGVAFGELVPNIDPEAWRIIDGKLYLQYAQNLDEDFGDDREELIADADAKWDGVKEKARR